MLPLPLLPLPLPPQQESRPLHSPPPCASPPPSLSPHILQRGSPEEPKSRGVDTIVAAAAEHGGRKRRHRGARAGRAHHPGCGGPPSGQLAADQIRFFSGVSVLGKVVNAPVVVQREVPGFGPDSTGLSGMPNLQFINVSLISLLWRRGASFLLSVVKEVVAELGFAGDDASRAVFSSIGVSPNFFGITVGMD